MSEALSLGRVLRYYFKIKKPFDLNENNEWVLNKAGYDAFLKFKSVIIDAQIETGEKNVDAILAKLDEIANIDLYKEKSK